MTDRPTPEPECEVEADRTWSGQYHCSLHSVWWRDTIHPCLCPVGVAIARAIRAERAEADRRVAEARASSRRSVMGWTPGKPITERDEHMFDRGKQTGIEQERAAVVRWLETDEMNWSGNVPLYEQPQALAERIERGEHRK